MPRRPKYRSKLSGLLVVDKPVGLSSAQVVTRVRFAAGNCKTGHAGTLDPLASGVLICCLGDATKASGLLMAAEKVYRTEVDLSAFSTTDDAEGERTEVAVATPPSAEAVASACGAMRGWVEQRPPRYSAVHVEGRRAYELARRGVGMDLPSRRVWIGAIAVEGYAWPVATLRITCGKGTYIRSIARDLGGALGTGGMCRSLRRLAVGPYTLEGAWSVERLAGGVKQEDLLAVPG